MGRAVRQQIVISGVGGQGVLFVTRLLAEAAIRRHLAVFTSETHGMAQRGGTVVSHLKVGAFSSPLIRPAQADGILALKAETLAQHGAYAKAGGWAAVNTAVATAQTTDLSVFRVDADRLARQIGNPRAVNLIVLGFSLSPPVNMPAGADSQRLFCSFEDVVDVLKTRFSKNTDLLAASLNALDAGYRYH
jgi:indolepyruvate ferredoxin oxidoreductase beta subunit